MTLTEQIAEVLKAHRLERYSVSSGDRSEQWGHCLGCSYESHTFPIKGMNWDWLAQEIFANHVASIISDLVVALVGPEF